MSRPPVLLRKHAMQYYSPAQKNLVETIDLHCTHVLRLELFPPVSKHRLAQRLHKILTQKTEVGVHHCGGRPRLHRLFCFSSEQATNDRRTGQGVPGERKGDGVRTRGCHHRHSYSKDTMEATEAAAAGGGAAGGVQGGPERNEIVFQITKLPSSRPRSYPGYKHAQRIPRPPRPGADSIPTLRWSIPSHVDGALRGT